VVFPAKVVPIHFGACKRRHSSGTAGRCERLCVGFSALRFNTGRRNQRYGARRDRSAVKEREMRSERASVRVLCVHRLKVERTLPLPRARPATRALRDGDVTDGSRDVTSPRGLHVPAVTWSATRSRPGERAREAPAAAAQAGRRLRAFSAAASVTCIHVDKYIQYDSAPDRLCFLRC